MNTHNQAIQNSLRCLQHPLSLAGIGVLLLNDHVFKIISPSWLTGKLSDFAGLFFFPFIVAAVFSLLLAKFNLKSGTIGRLAFASVVLWFAMLKTLPLANHTTNILLSRLVNHPVQLVIDWSDTFALLMLWPAWKLWDRSFQVESKRISYAPLMLGLLACMATSPALPGVEVVTHLIEKNENIYAIDSTNDRMALSKDGGTTWEWTDEYDFSSLPNEFRPLPITVCLADNQEHCYRIDGREIVEESHDGGQSWEISWQLPADRLSYIKRIDPDIDIGPYDLLITEWESHFYILVTTGEEGILRRELPDGEWDRIAVQDATPTPYKSSSLFDVIPIIWKELLVWFFLSIITFMVACWIVWQSNSKTSQQHLSKLEWIFSPALSTVLGIFLTLFIEIVMGFLFYVLMEIATFVVTLLGNTEGFFSIALIFCIGMTLGVLPLTIYNRLNTWRSTLIRHGYPRSIAQRLVGTSFLSHVFVLVVGALTWLCWAIDIISNYNVALVSALICTGLIAMFFWKRIENLSGQHLATTEK